MESRITLGRSVLSHVAALSIMLGLVALLFATDIADNFIVFVLLLVAGTLAVQGVYALARRGARDHTAADAQRDRFLKAVAWAILLALTIWGFVQLLA